MPISLLDALEHYCFHTPLLKIHQHPDLHHCDAEDCAAVVHPEMAEKAHLISEDGSVRCPKCDSSMTLKTGDKVAEVHVKLCTDPTIHYPDKYKAGELSHEDFTAWKTTLTRDELIGHYKRVPDHHVVAHFTHEETALIETDKEAFTKLMQGRIRERAESAILHQVPHRHKTTTSKLTL